MTQLPRARWDLHFSNDRVRSEWYASYGDFDHGYRWQVEYALNHLLFPKKPWLEFKSTKCSDCMDGLYLQDVSHSGIGDKIVQLLIWYDVPNQLIVPLRCELLDTMPGDR